MLKKEDIAEVFNGSYPNLCSFVQSIVGSNGQAQEIAQESFLRLCQTEIKDIANSEIRFWLFRVARNIALNELNKDKTHKRYWKHITNIFNKDGLTPEEILLEKENHRIVRQLLNQLPEQQRSALILREQEEMSYKDIALVLNISESKVKVDIFRGRQKLRSLWFEKQNNA